LTMRSSATARPDFADAHYNEATPSAPVHHGWHMPSRVLTPARPFCCTTPYSSRYAPQVASRGARVATMLIGLPAPFVLFEAPREIAGEQAAQRVLRRALPHAEPAARLCN
ncbi:MAG: hypothetical protein WBD83_13390, partial [Xanthobacteraceae bacterium]